MSGQAPVANRHVLSGMVYVHLDDKMIQYISIYSLFWTKNIPKKAFWVYKNPYMPMKFHELKLDQISSLYPIVRFASMTILGFWVGFGYICTQLSWSMLILIMKIIQLYIFSLFFGLITHIFIQKSSCSHMHIHSVLGQAPVGNRWVLTVYMYNYSEKCWYW